MRRTLGVVSSPWTPRPATARRGVRHIVALGGLLLLAGCYQTPAALDGSPREQAAANAPKADARALPKAPVAAANPAVSGHILPPPPDEAKSETRPVVMAAAGDKPMGGHGHDAPVPPEGPSDRIESQPLPVLTEAMSAPAPAKAHMPAPAHPAGPEHAGAPHNSPPAGNAHSRPHNAAATEHHKERSAHSTAAHAAETAHTPPPPHAASRDHPPRHRALAADAPADPAFAVHITSYRSFTGARKDWKRLVRKLPEQLLGLRARIATIDLGPPKGVYYRLKAGPLPTRQFARKLCGSLRHKGMYCAVMKFTGRPIS